MAFGNLGEAFIKVSPSFAGFSGALSAGLDDSIKGVVGRLGEEISGLGRDMLRKFALPMGVALAANVAQWQALDAQIRETVTLFGSGGLGGVVNQQFNEMEEGVFDLSKSLGVLQEGIAGGLYQAISAGVPRNNVFSFLETAQQASIGGAVDLRTAVDGLTTGMNAFGFEAGEAGEVSDILFRGVARGKTTFEELSASMARAAPLAAGAGVEFSEFIAIISAMTFQGTQTAEAYTNVKAALTGLLRPSEDMNKLWEEQGFLSGEAAIEALGLQGAMDLVATSVDGSVSSLIKLLGGAEAANAVLQVTGDNAGVFNSILGDTQDAAGATDQAFDTMAGGIGRSFGELTAAFDRLGGAGGQLASGFVQPVVEALTGVVSTFADYTKNIGKALEPVQRTFKTFIDTIFNNAIVQHGIALFATFVVTVGALGSALGLALLTAGSFMSILFGRTVFGRVGLLRKGLQLLGDAALWSGGRIFDVGDAIKGTGRLARTSSRALTGLGRSVQGMAKFFTPSIFLGFTAFLGATVFLVGKINKTIEDTNTNIKVAGEGSLDLADRLGLVTRAIGELDLPTGEDRFKFSIDFQIENADEILRLEEIKNTLGVDAAGRALFEMAFNWVSMGNDPEAVMDAIQQLNLAGGLNIDLNFTTEDIQSPRLFFDAIVADAKSLAPRLEGVGKDALAGFWKGGPAALGRENAVLRGDLEQLASSVRQLFSDDQSLGYDALVRVNQLLGDSPAAMNKFNDSFLELLNTSGNLDLESGFFENFDTTLDDVLRIAKEGGIDLRAALFQPGERFDPALFFDGIQLQEEFEQSYGEITAVTNTFTKDQIQAWLDIQDGMEGAFADAADLVLDRQNEITQGFLDQMPLLSIYGGALEHTFDDWKDAQDAFQSDFKKWNEDTLPAIVEALGEDLASIIDQSEGLDSKAWLSNLKPEEFQTAMDELAETYGTVTTEASNVFVDELPDILEEARALIDAKYSEMEVAAGEAGENVAEAFARRYGLGAAGWAPIAGFYSGAFIQEMRGTFGIDSPSKVMIDMANNLADSFGAQISRRSGDFNVSPSVNGSAGGGGGGAREVTVNINNPSGQSVAGMTQEALAVASLLGRVT